MTSLGMYIGLGLWAKHVHGFGSVEAAKLVPGVRLDPVTSTIVMIFAHTKGPNTHVINEDFGPCIENDSSSSSSCDYSCCYSHYCCCYCYSCYSQCYFHLY